MSDILFKVNIHVSRRDTTETELREIVEQALNVCMVEIEKRDPLYIGYKIREAIDLGE